MPGPKASIFFAALVLFTAWMSYEYADHLVEDAVLIASPFMAIWLTVYGLLWWSKVAVDPRLKAAVAGLGLRVKKDDVEGELGGVAVHAKKGWLQFSDGFARARLIVTAKHAGLTSGVL